MFVKALRSKKINVGLDKTFNLSYHMINLNCKPQSYDWALKKYKISYGRTK